MIATKKQQAELAHHQGDWEHAKNRYEQYLKKNHHDADTLHALGIVYAHLKQFNQAKAKISAAIQINPHQFTYHNSLGNIALATQNYTDAETAYKKSIKLNSTYAIAYNNLGNVYYYQKKYIAAARAYEKAIALKSDYADVYCNLGILQTHLSHDADAIMNLEKSLQYHPNFLKAQAQLANLYLRNAEYAKARDLFLQCNAAFPNHIDFLHDLGVAYFHLRDFEKAKTMFEAVLMQDYKHIEVNQYLANTFLELGEHEKALHYYYRQLEIQPLYEAYYNVGVLLMMRERHKDALIYFKKALTLNPDDVAAELNCGHLYLKHGEHENAILHYQKANALKPNDSEIQHILSALTQQETAAQAPDSYVSHLFDQYAPYYDKHLQDYLKYTVPTTLLNAIELEFPMLDEKSLRILDLGCGTGLCGSLFKPYAKELIGIDLSENMLAVAKQKQCYDKLIEADVISTLASYHALDLIIAGDVLPYFGDLSQLFYAVHQSLIVNGLFIFTVEKTHESDFILQKTIRYAHRREYLLANAIQFHFDVLRLENITLRQQKNDVIDGYLVLLKKPT